MMPICRTTPASISTSTMRWPKIGTTTTPLNWLMKTSPSRWIWWKQVEIDIKFYILQLVQQYHDCNCNNKGNHGQDHEGGYFQPRCAWQKELIEKFIERMTPSAGGMVDGTDVTEDWEILFSRNVRNGTQLHYWRRTVQPPEATRNFMASAEVNGFIETRRVHL